MFDGIWGDIPADGQGFESMNVKGCKSEGIVEIGTALVHF
jgi:hypothetical protein